MTNLSGNPKIQSVISPTSILLKAHETALDEIKILLNGAVKESIYTALQEKTETLQQNIDNITGITNNIKNEHADFEEHIKTIVLDQSSYLKQATTAMGQLQKQLDDLISENSQLQSLIRKTQIIDDIHKFSSETAAKVKNLLKIVENTKQTVDSIVKHENIFEDIQQKALFSNNLLKKIQQDLEESIRNVEKLKPLLEENRKIENLLKSIQNTILENKNEFATSIKMLDNTIKTDKPQLENYIRQSKKTLIILVVISTVASFASILVNIIT